MGLIRKKVLWVDDEIEYLRSHIMFLETRGYSVTPVFSGDDAIHIITEKPDEFDIVLLDEQMPGKGGLATLAEIKEMTPDLPVVMVTKSEEEQLMEEALGRKIDGYLTKPVNPSQILLVCKRLLHSKEIVSTKLKQDFGRNYSANRDLLQERMDYNDWIMLYRNLVKWDIELENIRDEGIRQAHIGQKSDANKLFSEFIVAKYMFWCNAQRKPPVLSHQILDTYVIPRLKSKEKVFFIILDSMRYDQYVVISSLLKKFFHLDNYTYYTILPSSTEFTRSSILSGLFPNEIAERFPELWEKTLKTAANNNNTEAVNDSALLESKLSATGFKPEETMHYIKLTDESNETEVWDIIKQHNDKNLIAIDVDFFDMFIRGHATSKVLQDIAPDEIAFRKLTVSLFERSRIYKILKKLASQDCTVIFTTCNGACLCTRGTEFYGDAVSNDNLRYRFGNKITCDERYAYFLHEPHRFNLPQDSPETSYVVLKENFHFISHDVYKNYNEQYINTFHHGGISMEEIIVPLAVMTPKYFEF
ncbi:MAG: bifunctional response regulator/alkaline phosphatase family protein [Chitinispirillia bacterium]|jgi:CheY-like chemotaxis protein